MLKTQYVDEMLLNQYVQRSGLKIGHVVEKLGISRQAYYKKTKGKIAFRASEVYALCKMLDIPEEDEHKIFCF